MCEECAEAPVRFVAYFNKPGGRLWRPAQPASAGPSVIGAPSDPAPSRQFSCVQVPGDAAQPAPPPPDMTA